MKKSKKIVALSTVTIMLMSSISTAFAAEASNPTFVLPGIANYSFQQKAEEVKATTYSDLAVIKKGFYSNVARYYGDYPTVANMTGMNYKIYLDLLKVYNEYVKFDVTASDDITDYTNNYFKVSYTVDNFDRYAKITVTANSGESYAFLFDKDYTFTYYVDKFDFTEMTKDAFDVAIKDAEAVAKEEKAAEEADSTKAEEALTMVSLKKFAEKLGYVVTWEDSSKSVKLTKGSVSTTVYQDKNLYTLADGTKIELASAPVNEDGVIYVPVTFFTEVLKAVVQIDTEGNIEINLPK